jgi:precorrin-3B methylase
VKHPNTLAAVIAAAAAIGAQWLVQRYAHVALSDYWKTTVTSGVTVTVLYVGKAGVKAALVRVWNGPRRAWSGAGPRPKP